MSSKRSNKVWRFPTKISDMKKQFDFLLQVEILRNKYHTNSKEELARFYKPNFGKRNEDTCMNYFNECRRLGILSDSEDKLDYTSNGKQALFLYQRYREDGNLEHLKEFNKVLDSTISQHFKVDIEGNVIYPFAIIHYFMKRMGNKMYDVELFFLMLTSSMQEVEEVIELSNHIRSNQLNKTEIINLIELQQEEKGLTENDISNIFKKYIGIPKNFLYQLDLVDREKSSKNGETIGDDFSINFTSKIVLK